MQRRQLLTNRQGFTLVEVALAVAVGLIVIGGAILAFNAVKENANNSNAQNRVLSAVTLVEEFAGSNNGRYPTSAATGGTFQALWASKHPDDRTTNPWGGATGDATDGAIEIDACDFGSASEPTTATDTTAALQIGAGAANAANAANLIYVSATAAATPWAAIRQQNTMTILTVKNYAVGICDKNGVPWWSAKCTSK
ncbi:MAG: prepilin-type N-terminal cleavage/methylation domain-containing protein [Candidatus Sericytochromatia bacterium]|nr:prepilin-type N-terminal cleavage/methylation domain-containing protein [Candidatus Sericytochromatia bacterium]